MKAGSLIFHLEMRKDKRLLGMGLRKKIKRFFCLFFVFVSSQHITF